MPGVAGSILSTLSTGVYVCHHQKTTESCLLQDLVSRGEFPWNTAKLTIMFTSDLVNWQAGRRVAQPVGDVTQDTGASHLELEAARFKHRSSSTSNWSSFRSTVRDSVSQVLRLPTLSRAANSEAPIMVTSWEK